MCFTIILGALAVSFLAMAAGFFYMNSKVGGSGAWETSPSPSAFPVMSEIPASTPQTSPLASAGPDVKRPVSDLIHPTSPLAGSVISSPVTIEGEARGIWFFEASFPAHVVDANGTQLCIAPIQAQGEWMTEEFVPYRGTVEFSAPRTDTGFVVLQLDNPSDMHKRDAALAIPVRFK